MKHTSGKKKETNFTKKKKFKLAIGKYVRARQILISSAVISSDIQKDKETKEIEIPCIRNTALCQLKLGDFQRAIESSEMVIRLDPGNCKGYYRRGIAHKENGSYIEAEKDFKKAMELGNSSDKKSSKAELR